MVLFPHHKHPAPNYREVGAGEISVRIEDCIAYTLNISFILAKFDFVL